MTTLTFTKDGNVWKNTSCPVSCTLQVQLKKQGIITVSAGLSGMPEVLVESYSGDNMIREVNLPEGCTVTITCSEEVVSAGYNA